MADISITDNLGASASLKLRDDSPLAKAKLSQLASTAGALISELAKPINAADVGSISVGLTAAAPSALIADATKLILKAGVNATLSVLKPKDKIVFPDDGFAPAVSIRADECWVGIEIDAALSAKVAASADGFGIGLAGSSTWAISTYTLCKSAAGTFPTLRDCIESALENYCVPHTADAVSNLKPGTISLVKTSGTVKFTGSYALPINVSALASAELPFQYTASVVPAICLKVAGEIAVSGSFHVRLYKTPDGLTQLALYKEKGTDLTVSFNAGAGVNADIAQNDVLSAFLGAVLPSVDPKKAGLTNDESSAIKSVLKQSIDQSLAISINGSCSASFSEEMAVAYSLDLTAGDTDATHAAITSALRGDWTALAALPNAKCIRDVITRTEEHKHKIAINLLGFYNAASVADYVKSCTILRDENGRIFITDKAQASRISTVSLPYLADSARLRQALADTFLASVTYAATTTGAIGQRFGANLKIQQQYFHYDSSLTRQEMRDEILLGIALGLIQTGTWDGVLYATPKFGHVRVSASAEYDGKAALSLFLADPVTRTCRTSQELAAVGRKSLASLIDASDPAGQVRLAALSNNAIWKEMDDLGNMAAFSTIPYLSHLGATDIAAVSADWAAIRWWADSMLKLGPKLVDLLKAVDQSTAVDPTADSAFMKKRDELWTALQHVARSSHAAFADGWGIAVLYALAPVQPQVSMDINWASNTRHYEAIGRGVVTAAGA